MIAGLHPPAGSPYAIPGYDPNAHVTYGGSRFTHYMLLVVSAVYLITARLFSPSGVPRAVTLDWAVAVVYSAVELYPIRSLGGH